MEFLYSVFIFFGFLTVSYDIVTASKFFLLSSVTLLFPYFGISLTFGFMLHLLLVIRKQSLRIEDLKESLKDKEKSYNILSKNHKKFIGKTIIFASRFKTPAPHHFEQSKIKDLLD